MAALCWSSREEIPHAQGKRIPSKTVDVASNRLPDNNSAHGFLLAASIS